MSLNDYDLPAIDAVVCRGIGKRPGQTILERAHEIMANPFVHLGVGKPNGAVILRACRALTDRPSVDPLDRMRMAARILAPIVKGEP